MSLGSHSWDVGCLVVLMPKMTWFNPGRAGDCQLSILREKRYPFVSNTPESYVSSYLFFRFDPSSLLLRGCFKLL